LVEYLNSQALAENICKVIEDEQLRKRLGENAKQNIQRFSQDAIMRQWTDLFDLLLNTQKQ
jgi:glycosyltransferase involved in cell wall biosynthesis